MTPRSERTLARRVRWGLLLVVLGISTALGLLHQKGGTWRPPGVDALCPFGGIEAAFSLFADGVLLHRVAWSSVILLIVVLVIALVFRRSFCGLVCPLGTLQEVFGRLGRRLFGRQLTVPAGLDRVARYLKYAVLVVFVYLSWTTAELAIRPYDPWAAYHHLFSDELLTTLLGGTIVLGVSVAGSLLYDRFFCKYLCPMGAFLALLTPFGLFRVRRDEGTCTSCGMCDKACPVNLAPSTVADVTDPECINCNECVTACPVEGCLTVSEPRGTRVRPMMVIVSIVAMIALFVGATTASGHFGWESGPGSCGGSGGGGGGGGSHESSESGDAPADASLEIRGQTSFAEISDAYGIPADAITAAFGVPESEQGLPMSETKATYGFSPGEVRSWVGFYLQDPAGAAEYAPGTFSDSCE